MKIFAFWHDKKEIPGWLQLCFNTWERHIHSIELTLLDFNVLGQFLSEADMRRIDAMRRDRRYKLMQISDFIRVSLLRLHGGLWMDLDTIITSDAFEKEILDNAIGAREDNTVFSIDEGQRGMTNGFIMARPGSRFIAEYKKWLDNRVDATMKTTRGFKWDYLANAFSNPYLLHNKSEFNQLDIRPTWPELTLDPHLNRRKEMYNRLYFMDKGRSLGEIPYTSILMLHNNWTPDWYKKLAVSDVLNHTCTMSNILRELTQ